MKFAGAGVTICSLLSTGIGFTRGILGDILGIGGGFIRGTVPGSASAWPDSSSTSGVASSPTGPADTGSEDGKVTDLAQAECDSVVADLDFLPPASVVAEGVDQQVAALQEGNNA